MCWRCSKRNPQWLDSSLKKASRHARRRLIFSERKIMETVVQEEKRLEQETVRKVTWRLLPFLMVCYLFAFIDRGNIGMAALQMNHDIGLSSKMFGFASSLFFIAYFIFEVPSNLALQRFGARKWLARIMITWGAGAVFAVFRALLAGRCGSGLFPRCGVVPDLLGSFGLSCAHRGLVHGGDSGGEFHCFTGLGIVAADGRHHGRARMALAVRH
jgi:sugar phosphate permease